MWGAGTVRVDLTARAGAAPGVGDDVVLVAASVEAKPTSNSSVVHFSASSSTTQNRH